MCKKAAQIFVLDKWPLFGNKDKTRAKTKKDAAESMQQIFSSLVKSLYNIVDQNETLQEVYSIKKITLIA